MARIYGGGSSGAIPIITEWQTFTPSFTGFGTVTSATGVYRRVGDSIELQVGGVTGTPTAVLAAVTLPASLTAASSSKLPATYNMVGQFLFGNASGAIPNIGNAIIQASSTTINFSYRDSGNGSFTALNGNVLIASSTGFQFKGTIPIDGWTTTT